MRRIAIAFGLTAALAAVSGCKSTTKIDPLKYAAIEVDEKGMAPVAPPKQGDVARTFPAERSKVAKAFFRNMSSNVGDGDFAIDQERGKWFFQREGSVESRVRQLRGKGPGGHWMLVELRSDDSGTTAIVRGSTPGFEEAAAIVLLDKVEAELKGRPADGPMTKS